MKQKLIAKKAFTLDDENRPLKKGEEFEATERWATLYLAAGYAEKVMNDTPKPKRRYRRRDMQVEE